MSAWIQILAGCWCAIVLGAVSAHAQDDLSKVAEELKQDRKAAIELAEKLGSVELDERRDAAYELANLGPAALPAIDALVKGLDDRDEQVWMQSAMAVARIGPEATKAIDALIENLSGRDDQRRYRAAWALSRIGPATIEPLIEVIRSGDSTSQRLGAIDAFGWMIDHTDEVTPVLLDSIESDEESVRLQAARSLARLRSSEALSQALDTEHPEVQSIAAAALADAGPISPSTRDRLIELTRRGENEVRATTVVALVSTDVPRDELASIIVDTALSDDGEMRSGAVVALRKLNDLSVVVERLIEALRSEEASKRSAAAFALGMLGRRADSAVPALIEALKHETDDSDAVATSISRIGTPAVSPLLEAFLDPDQSSDQLARALAMIGPAATAPLVDALDNQSVQVQVNAASALAAMDPTPEQAIDALAKRIDHDSPEVRRAVTLALAGCAKLSDDLLDELRPFLNDSDAGVRAAATAAIAKHSPDRNDVLEMLTQSLSDPDAAVRGQAIASLGELGSAAAKASDAISNALEDDSGEVRRAAALTLGGLEEAAKDSVESIAELLSDPDPETQAAAAWAIGQIGTSSSDVIAKLTARLNDESSESVLMATLTALTELGSQANQGSDEVIRLLDHPKVSVRRAAVACLASIEADTSKSVPLLIASLEDDDWTVRRDAAGGLGKIGSPAATPAIPKLLHLLRSEEDSDAARGAIRSIDDAGPEAVPLLIEDLQSEDRGRKFYAVYLLGKVGPDGKEALPALKLFRDETESNRFKEMIDRTIESIESP